MWHLEEIGERNKEKPADERKWSLRFRPAADPTGWVEFGLYATFSKAWAAQAKHKARTYGRNRYEIRSLAR